MGVYAVVLVKKRGFGNAFNAFNAHRVLELSILLGSEESPVEKRRILTHKPSYGGWEKKESNKSTNTISLSLHFRNYKWMAKRRRTHPKQCKKVHLHMKWKRQLQLGYDKTFTWRVQENECIPTWTMNSQQDNFFNTFFSLSVFMATVQKMLDLWVCARISHAVLPPFGNNIYIALVIGRH